MLNVASVANVASNQAQLSIGERGTGDGELEIGKWYWQHYHTGNIKKSHAALDALVDKAYGLNPTCTDAERVAHLFKLYSDIDNEFKGSRK